MTGYEMIKNCEEIFGVQHSYTYQIKDFIRCYGEDQAKIVYDVMLQGEKINIENKIIELQNEIKNLENKLDRLENM